MNLFDEFKKNIPDNNELCKQAAGVVLKGKDAVFVKEKFSSLFEEMQEEIYRQYLLAQNKSGQLVIDNQIAEKGVLNFADMDKLLMSIFQSRKSRAGGAFEFVITELFTRLGYPFSTQVNIEGATPDFVLPSEKYFREDPLGSIIFTAKRTLRERWRQVVTEANKGYGFFLATIDNKVSASQIKQMEKHKVHMVVPESLHNDSNHYRQAKNVITFENFFKHHLDPAMERWELRVSESPAEYSSDQKKLF